LTKPASEWRVIEVEPSSTGKLIGGYAVLLAVIAPIMALLAILLTPFGSALFSFPVFLIELLLITYAMALLPPVLLGFILDALTPNLGGTKNSLAAMKLTIYSGTAYWVGAVGLILSPWLWIVIGAGYAGYLLWIGAPILMKVPADKAPVFVGAAVGIWVVLYIILNLIAQKILVGAMMSAMTGGLM
jgi:hypothetical protein